MSRNQNITFFQGELQDPKYQMFSEDLPLSCNASVYTYQLKQSPSTKPNKRLLNGLSWKLTDTCTLAFSY